MFVGLAFHNPHSLFFPNGFVFRSFIMMFIFFVVFLQSRFPLDPDVVHLVSSVAHILISNVGLESYASIFLLMCFQERCVVVSLHCSLGLVCVVMLMLVLCSFPYVQSYFVFSRSGNTLSCFIHSTR